MRGGPLVGVACAALCHGCSSSAAPALPSAEGPLAECPAGAPAGDFPLDVAAVLRSKCQSCHSSPPRNHAPFALVDYEETLAQDSLAPYTGRPIWQVMYAVIQPTGVPHMPFGSAPQLTTSELQTLTGWLAACATPVAEGTGGDLDSVGATDASSEVGSE